MARSIFYTFRFVCNEEYEWDSFHLRHIHNIFNITSSTVLCKHTHTHTCEYDRIKIKNNIRDILAKRQEDSAPWMNHKPAAVWRRCIMSLSLCVLVCVSTWVPLLEFTKSNCTNEKAHIKQLVDACSYVMLPIVVHVLLYTIQKTIYMVSSSFRFHIEMDRTTNS